MTTVVGARVLVVLSAAAWLTACAKDSGTTPSTAPARIIAVSGDAQSAIGPVALPAPLVVRVLDTQNDGVAGVAVTWGTSDTTGRLSSSTTTTDATGSAQVTWTLGQTLGTQTVAATAAGVSGAKAVFQGTNAAPTISGGVTVALAPPLSFVGAVGTSATRLRSGIANAGVQGAMVRREPAKARLAFARGGTGTRRLIVQFRPGPMGLASHVAATAAARQGALQAMQRLLAVHQANGIVSAPEHSPAILASRVTVPSGIALASAMATLQADPGVESVTVDSIYPMLGSYAAARLQRTAGSVATPAAVHTSSLAGAVPGVLPNDPDLVFQYWHYNMVDAPRAWATVTGSASVLVAVVDNGIRFDHPAIAGNLTRDGYNFVTGGNRLAAPQPVCEGGTTLAPEAGYGPDPTDPDDLTYTGTCWDRSEIGNHGLHVSGTIGAVGNDGIGSTGLNWSVRIRPVRVLDITGSGSDFDVAQGILYAAGLPASNGAGGTVTAPSRAALINMSLEGGYSIVMQNAVIAATNAGSLIIAAAGNDDVNEAGYPGAFAQVLPVVALGPDMQLASYTNIGVPTAIAAPGGDIRFDATGDGSAGVLSSTWDFVHGAPDYAYYEGTSMATPHVTGVAALVLASNPGLTAMQLRARLQGTAVDLGAPGPDDSYGYGLVNAYNAINNVSGPLRATYVRIVNAATGDTVKTVPVQADGSYSVTLSVAGSYYVVAGQDEAGDGRIGVPGRRFGWYGPPSGPAAVTVGAGQHATASVTVGTPVAAQPAGSFATANRLVLNGYAINNVASNGAGDYYAVTLPRSGTYYFETGGVLGSCGLGLELDTILTLYNSAFTQLATNDDTPLPGSLYCSAITTTLSAGTYYLRVTGSAGSFGQYRIWVRDQP
jgi:subtilisin family serine protease